MPISEARPVRLRVPLLACPAVQSFDDIIYRIAFMWCSTCHQDVPGVAQTKGRTVCARCQQPLPITRPAYAGKICDEGLALDEPAAALAATAPPLGGLDAQSREHVRRLGRQLRRPTAEVSTALHAIPTIVRRFDPPQNLLNELDAAATPSFAPFITDAPAIFTARTRRPEATQVIAWLIVLVGVLTLLGGLALIGWTLSNDHMSYWNQALGLTLGGQGLLIFGLVLVVTRLWRNSRHASSKLHDVTARLAQLQSTADALTAMRSGGAPAFYADLVRGASPQTLLANLKGQLDQLATRLGSGW
jgi:hypothetical protein